MPSARFTVRRCENNRAQVAVAAGTAEAQNETLSINIDYNVMSRGDVLLMIDAAKAKIIAEPWPPLA